MIRATGFLYDYLEMTNAGEYIPCKYGYMKQKEIEQFVFDFSKDVKARIRAMPE